MEDWNTIQQTNHLEKVGHRPTTIATTAELADYGKGDSIGLKII